MAAFIDISGQKFNYLTAIRKSDFRGSGEGRVYWECECECGKKTRTRGNELRNGTAISCGCKSKVIKHGKSRSKEYRTWQAMKRRVYDTESPRKKYYFDNLELVA